MAEFFLKRPTFAIVVSMFIVILGLLSLKEIPTEYYPKITPVEIAVMASFPGASAETMSRSVAAPLEQAINGVDDMIYMYSQNASPGNVKLVVSFKVGTDPDMALINTQSRVNLALSSLPIDVQNQGVIVSKQEPSVAIFVALQDKKGLHDDVFVANYGNIFVADKLSRLDGVSTAKVLNARDYSMRIWLKPDRLAQFGMTVKEVAAAVQEQNGERSIGLIGAEPLETASQLTIPIGAMGRLNDPKEFENIVLRATKDGAIIYLKDVSRIDLGAQSYDVVATMNGQSGAFIGVYQNAGSNTIDVSNRVRNKMEEISQFFPEGLSYSIPYDTSDYIKQSIWQVEKTLLEVVVLVGLVIVIFLHSIGATLVPLIAMLVSIAGTFIAMYLFGFSLNTLSLFGLVMSVGIVVDDAIVVVESIERNIRLSALSAKDAAFRTMKEVSKPIVAIMCVLAAVFIPVSFVGGIPGEFYRQFAITIAVSVVISGFIALTLSPTLSIMFLKKSTEVNKFGKYFDHIFDSITEKYVQGARWVLLRPKKAITMCFIVVGLIGFFALTTPLGFVPKEDQGLILVSAALPDGSSLSRVEAVSNQIEQIAMSTPGVADVLAISGYSLIES
ncbi:MAG: hydrophobe/amphiphile efflux-1 family RND transporter, partial [Chlamydiae bacterium CG10_big_fil_rev_8_21_14_0_10_42_34]